ncbi:MAG: S1C family serine protease [Candidatus Acidiferrales bacterium]
MLRFATKLLPTILVAATVAAAQSAPPQKSIPAIAKAANGAVVSIVMSDKDGNPVAQGSGFVVSKDGDILTNYHVIAEGASALVKLPDGAFYVVDGVLAADKARDIAVIKAHGENFRTLALGDSDRVQVGQEVVAIGNPLSLESTVSNGIVSSVRSIDEKGGKYLQITAPISPGSSGGPLFNMEGQVVGITTMYIKVGENLNFAIPINDVKPLLETHSAKLQNFPNEPEPTPTNAPPSTTGEALASQVNSPAYRYYQELLKNEDSILSGSTYACFEDDSQSATFIVIWASVMNKRTMSVIIYTNTNGVSDTDAGEDFEGQLTPSIDGSLSATLHTRTVYKIDFGHDTDTFEWGPDQLTMKTGFGKVTPPFLRTTLEFDMQRSTGRYIEHFVMYSPDRPTTTDKTGKCIRIPNTRTPEEEYLSLK